MQLQSREAWWLTVFSAGARELEAPRRFQSGPSWDLRDALPPNIPTTPLPSRGPHSCIWRTPPIHL